VIGAITHMDSEINEAADRTKGNDMKRMPQWQGSA